VGSVDLLGQRQKHLVLQLVGRLKFLLNFVQFFSDFPLFSFNKLLFRLFLHLSALQDHIWEVAAI
jgi:hypothetical protein